MELRWVYYEKRIETGQFKGPITNVTVEYERVLQYREGVTHDCPWIDVPITFYQPPR